MGIAEEYAHKLATDRNMTDIKAMTADEIASCLGVSKDDEIQLMLLKHTKFSEIPQFYCDGKLVGGLEMLENLHE